MEIEHLPDKQSSGRRIVWSMVLLTTLGCSRNDSSCSTEASDTKTELTVEDARNALVQMLGSSDDDHLRYGTKLLKQSEVTTEQPHDVAFCSGTVRCNLRDKRFVIDLTTDDEFRDYQGVFAYDNSDKRWNARVVSSRQGHAHYAGEE